MALLHTVMSDKWCEIRGDLADDVAGEISPL